MSVASARGFSHVRRIHDPRFPHEIAAIMPGEYFVSREPMIVYTVLGSCISACIRDPIAGIGGMNHFMLPTPRGGNTDSWGESARYGIYAMEVLINDLLKFGALKSRFEVKVFGGGKIYEGTTDVGAKNAAWAIDFLKHEGLSVTKEDVGDIFPRKVYYFTQSGRVLLKKIERIKNRTIFEREQQYQESLRVRPTESDVTLF